MCERPLTKNSNAKWKKLNKAGMIINEDNCYKILYLGYQIAEDRISIDERLTKKIAKMSIPGIKKESEIFWGAICCDLIETFAMLRTKNVESY